MDVTALVLPFVAQKALNKVRKLFHRPKPLLREAVDLGPVRETMRRFWKEKLGVTDSTVEYFFRDAFDYGGYVDVIQRCRRAWGPLQGKRVLDVGCGWGSLSVLLSQEGADVSFIDLTPEHVQVTQSRVPQGKGFIGDACTLGSVPGLAGPFDYILVHSLIEHVAPPVNHRGEAAPTLEAKRKVLEGVSCLAAPGTGVFLSTGNYQFPLDGEIKTWFFHWLNPKDQLDVLKARGIDADRYGLFRWPELERIVTDVGLSIERIETSPSAVANVRRLLTVLSFLSSRGGMSLPRIEIEQLVRRVAEDPNWMPVWYAFFRKK